MARTETRRWWRQTEHGQERTPQEDEDTTPEKPPPVGATVKLSLPSSDEPLCFTVSVFVEAWWGAPHAAPPALFDIARGGITQRAERLSRGHTLTAAERLRVELNAELHRWDWVPGTTVAARGQCVAVDAEPELVAAVAAREEAIRRHLVVSWSDEHHAVRTERMSTLILNPLRATAAWFLDNQDKPEDVVKIAENFKQLRETLRPQQEPDTPGRLLDELLAATDDVRRARVFTMLEQMFKEYGHADLVVRLLPPEET